MGSSPLRLLLDRVTPQAHAVYLPAEAGPFRCDHCQYWAAKERCNEPHIVEAGRRGLFGLGYDGRLAVVDAGGCSDYYLPIPKKGASGA